MSNSQVGTLVWKKYKEPPKDPDSKWIIDTVRRAFSFGVHEETSQPRKDSIKQKQEAKSKKR